MWGDGLVRGRAVGSRDREGLRTASMTAWSDLWEQELVNLHTMHNDW